MTCGGGAPKDDVKMTWEGGQNQVFEDDVNSGWSLV